MTNKKLVRKSPPKKKNKKSKKTTKPKAKSSSWLDTVCRYFKDYYGDILVGVGLVLFGMLMGTALGFFAGTSLNNTFVSNISNQPEIVYVQSGCHNIANWDFERPPENNRCWRRGGSDNGAPIWLENSICFYRNYGFLAYENYHDGFICDKSVTLIIKAKWTNYEIGKLTVQRKGRYNQSSWQPQARALYVNASNNETNTYHILLDYTGFPTNVVSFSISGSELRDSEAIYVYSVDFVRANN